jgi:2-polyprenyl-6-methoxyphenol hydroxylase-like FAD-dependent oxidoreductase
LNDNDEITKKVAIGGIDFGYHNHRVWRGILLEEMRNMLKERSISIEYNSRFQGIVSDDDNGVSFLINESLHHASLLIGADGIYSTVRKHLAPDVVPEYTGLLGVLGHIKRSSVAWPYEDYEKNATIQSKPGAIFWIAEDPAGEDLMIGKQANHPEPSREELERLQADPDRLADFYRKDYDEYGPTARKIIDSVRDSKERLYAWPFLKMPRISQWYGESGRIVLVGDSVHALPPSSGQGVNQALEDVYSLTLLLTTLRDKVTVSYREAHLGALAFWQQMRQDRIDAVFDWTLNGSNVSRLPEAERKKLIAEGKVKEGGADDMGWLYRPVLDERIHEWIQSKC